MDVGHIYCDENGCFGFRREIVDPGGNWVANFAVVGEDGDEQDIIDITPGMKNEARQCDEDGDCTQYGWNVPNPNFNVRVNNDQVEAWEWELGADLILDVDNPSTPFMNPDYTTTAKVMGTTPWGDPRTYVSFDLSGEIDIQPGFLVSLSDGTITKTHEVTNLAITEIDLALDTISGVGSASYPVNVWICDNNGCNKRHVSIDQSGNWFADFGNPGPENDEKGTVDVKTGTSIDSGQYDEDGDSTMYGVGIPNPRIETSARDNWATAREWPFGTEVTLTVDDPSNGTGIDFTRYASMQQNIDNPYDPYDIGAFFDMSGIDVQPGFLLSMSADGSTKDLVVSEQSFTGFDFEADTVTGRAEPDVDVSVWACDNNNCYHRHTHTEVTGDWMVDFGKTGPGGDEQEIVDIVPGIWIDSVVNDVDGDGTYYGENAPEPGYPVCSPGDSVTGTVFFGDGTTPMSDVTIHFEDYLSGQILFITTTDLNGMYGCSLPEGDYRLWADGSSQNLSREYYNDTIYENAEQVVVTSASSRTGIDFIMDNPRLAHYFEQFAFNLDDPILGELAVRKAIAYGTDRQRMLDEAWRPNGTDGALLDTYVVPGHWAQAIAGGVVTYDYDPTAARAILAGAGWTDSNGDGIREKGGQPLQIYFIARSNHPARPITAEIFKENMAAIGVDVVVEVMSNQEWIDAVFNRRDFGMTEFAWGDCSDQNDDSCYPMSVWDTGDGQNISNYNNPAADAASAAARLENTRDGKLPYLVTHQKILSQDLPFFPLFTRAEVATSYLEEVQVTQGAPIQIAVSVDLSDEASEIGLSSLKAVKMAVEDFGAIQGFSIQLNEYDSECNFLGGLTAAVDILDNPQNTGVIGHTCSVSFSGALPYFEKAGLVTISGSTTNAYIPTLAPSVFNRTVLDDSVQPSQIWVPLMQNLNSVQNWRTGYLNRFGEEPDDYAVFFYDAARILLERIKQTAELQPDGSLLIDRSALASAVRATSNYQGVTGRIDLNEQGNRVDSGVISNVGAVGGGILSTPDGNVTLTIPEGALSADTTIFITDSGGGYEVTTNNGTLKVIGSYTILPHGTIFDPPASLTFHWDDGDDDGFVDGTEFSETLLLLVKDGVIVTPICAENPDCDMDNNLLTMEISSLSLFELAFPQNLPPVADAGEDLAGNEGDTYTLDASASSDPDGDELSYAWDLDNDGEFDDAIGAAPTVIFSDEGDYEVGLLVSDSFGFSDEDSVTITVANVAPSVGTIVAPIIPVQVSTSINVSSAFHDPGSDTIMATWLWGDGTLSNGVINGTNVTGSHTYFMPGVYTVTLSVADGDGGVGISTFQYVVIYDPDGGFVTGGGWIISPAGSYTADPALTGKTTLGFEAKYKKGDIVPKCNTEFDFKAAGLKFKSSACDWLIVSGPMAIYKGTGSINGSGAYTFYLTAYDSSAPGGLGVDKYRFMIIDQSTGNVIYDNMPGIANFEFPTTSLGGGSIVIHKAK